MYQWLYRAGGSRVDRRWMLMDTKAHLGRIKLFSSGAGKMTQLVRGFAALPETGAWFPVLRGS